MPPLTTRERETFAQFGIRTSLDQLTASIVARQSRRKNDDSASIPDQIAAARAWCAAQTPPIAVGAVYEEPDVSGRKPLEKRKGLRQAVEDVEEGRSQIVLAVYFDRYNRSVAVRAEVVPRVERAGGRVVTMDAGVDSDETAVQWLSGTMQAAIAEFYARQSGEKTIVSKQRNIDRGVPPFPRITPAYVRREDGTLEPHPHNGPLVAEACRMRAGIGYATRRSYGQILRYLQDEGLVMPEGGPAELTLTGVKSMLHSRLLIGEIHFGNFTPNLAAIDEPITDRATFRKMNEGSAPRGRYAKSERLLARQGVLVCGVCGARMVIHSSTNATHGVTYAYYRCGDRACGAAGIPADEADAFVSAAAIELASGYVGHATNDAEVAAAAEKAEKAQGQLAKATRILALSEDEDEARAVLAELTEKRDAAVEEHRRLHLLTRPATSVSAAADWDRLTLDERRGIIRATIARAVVAPGRGPGRITIEGRIAR